ncbi:MAG: geranylgeranylglycerol-phosphate geranylgeranyltransferase, partial [Candidatus Zixiibacteriota bacterium]
MFRLIETLKLIRLINCVMAMVAAWIGARMAWLHPVYFEPAVAGLAVFLVCAAGNVVNDCVDVEIDRINRPARPLVKGTLTRRYAFLLAAFFNLTAIGLSVLLSWPVTYLTVGAISLLYLYNYLLKKVPLLGNVVISLLAGLAFIAGGFAVDPVVTFYPAGPVVAAVFAFLFHLVREFIKDIADIEGDRAAGVRTLPQIIGEQRTLSWALVLFFILVVVTLLPILFGWFGAWYKIIAIYIIDLPLLLYLIFLWGNPT